MPLLPFRFPAVKKGERYRGIARRSSEIRIFVARYTGRILKMEDNYTKHSLRFIWAVLLTGLLYSCANIGSPNGGPYDEDPPRYISSTPLPNQTNFKGKTVDIYFDELIQIDNPSENVVVTPPQTELPSITASGRRIRVQLNDTLRENMTYTIDFTNSIKDNNEGNILENYSFAFATGDTIDSLQIAGFLLNAENLEPMSGVTVGIHSNLEDSAFEKLRFERITRTNDRGRFILRNVAPGSYRIYALNDVNRDYKFDQPGEDIAFTDSIIVPSFELTSRQDTSWIDSLTIDTIKTIGYTRFYPENVELRLFKEKFVRQYMTRPRWEDEHFFYITFNAPLDTFPEPRPLNFTPEKEDWYVVQPTNGGLQLNYWMLDSTVFKRDTLVFELTYPASDSLNVLRPTTDTLQVAIRRRQEVKEKRKKKNDDEPEPIEFLYMNIDAPSSMDIFDTVSIDFDTPVLEVKKENFHLNIMVDSVWTPIEFDFFRDSVDVFRYYINRKWKYGEAYRLEADSASIFGVYGKFNDKYASNFTIKPEDSYGHLYINTLGVDSGAYVEILNNNDVPVRKSAVRDGGALFMDLKPDKYYARLVLDLNGNGEWDTGKYSERRQPEQVFYCPKQFVIMQNFQVEETWDVYGTPTDQQKPLDITQNKPKTQTKRNYKDESNTNSSSSSSGISLPF